MAEKRKILRPVGKPSFSKTEAAKIVRKLREERAQHRQEHGSGRKK